MMQSFYFAHLFTRVDFLEEVESWMRTSGQMSANQKTDYIRPLISNRLREMCPETVN